MIPVASAAQFQCPPDCGWCCTHLKKEPSAGEKAAEKEFRDILRGEGIYGCADAARGGLALDADEARRLADDAARRGVRARIHPRSFLLESRRRVAVVLEWHLAHDSCPFYADYKCTAYEIRPAVCRAFPVLAPAPAWRLAPECPKIPASGEARLGSLFRAENVARRAIERAHVALDERVQRVLATPGARWSRGLPAREARARATRYRQLTPEEFEASCLPRATP